MAETTAVSLLNGTTADNVTYNQTCDGALSVERDFVNLLVGPAALVVFLMCFIQPRNTLCLSCCSSRPGVLYPINFIDEYQRRWAYVAAFLVIAYKVLLLFDGKYYYSPDEFQDPVWMGKFGFVRVFIQIVNVIQLGLVTYPFFACIAYRHNIFANIIGILYTCAWLGIAVLSILVCLGVNALNSDGEIERQLLFDMVFYVPVGLSYIVLIIAYIMDLVINIRNICKKKVSTEDAFADNQPEKDTSAQLYVRRLFLRGKRETPAKFLSKIKHKVTYEKIPGLRYSPRVICTMTVAAYGIMKFAVELGFYLDYVFVFLYDLVKVIGPEILGIEEALKSGNDSEAQLLFDRVTEGVFISRVVLAVSNGFSVLLHVAFMIMMVLSYRKHIRKYILGHHDWHYKIRQAPPSALVGSMRYSGYQIAFLIYGWILVWLVLFIVIMLLTFLIVIPLRDGYSTPAIDKIKSLWPTLFISLVILFGQRLVAKFAFLQESGKYMALNNRRWFHVLTYFLFFFNILLGLFGALKRILISLVAGLLLISRLDRVLMMRGFERFDTGFNAYLGMIQTEVWHTHPIMRYFVECLKTSAASRKKQLVHPEEGDAYEEWRKKRHRQVLKNKWYKAITLVNNPSILVERLNKMMTEQMAESGETHFADKIEVIQDAVNKAAMVSKKPLYPDLEYPLLNLSDDPNVNVNGAGHDIRSRPGHQNSDKYYIDGETQEVSKM